MLYRPFGKRRFGSQFIGFASQGRRKPSDTRLARWQITAGDQSHWWAAPEHGITLRSTPAPKERSQREQPRRPWPQRTTNTAEAPVRDAWAGASILTGPEPTRDPRERQRAIQGDSGGSAGGGPGGERLVVDAAGVDGRGCGISAAGWIRVLRRIVGETGDFFIDRPASTVIMAGAMKTRSPVKWSLQGAKAPTE